MKKICLFSGIAVVLLEGIFILWLVPAHSQAAEGRPTPDMQTLAPPIAIEENLASWNSEARQIYRWFQLTDTLFPLAYGLFLFSALSLLTRQGIRFLPALPLLGMAFDYLENGAVRWALTAGSEAPGFLYPLITAAGTLKMALLGVSLVLTAGLFVRFLYQRNRRLPRLSQ